MIAGCESGGAPEGVRRVALTARAAGTALSFTRKHPTNETYVRPFLLNTFADGLALVRRFWRARS